MSIDIISMLLQHAPQYPDSGQYTIQYDKAVMFRVEGNEWQTVNTLHYSSLLCIVVITSKRKRG